MKKTSAVTANVTSSSKRFSVSQSLRRIRSEDGEEGEPSGGLPHCRRLPVKIAWNAIGSIATTICHGSVLIILARTGDAASVGELALAFAVTSPIFMFTGLQLRSLQMTDGVNKYSFDEYLGLRCLTTLAALAVALLVAYIIVGFGELWAIIAALSMLKCIESVADIFYGLFQCQGQAHLICLSQVVKGVVTVIAIALTLWSTHNLGLALIIATAANLLILVFIDIWLSIGLTAFRPRILWNRSLPLIRLAAPLGFVAAFSSATTTVPQLAIIHWHGSTELGYFAASAYFLKAVGMIVMAAQQAMSPWLAQLHHRDIGKFIHFYALLLRWVTMLGLAGLAVTWLVGKPLLECTFGSEFGNQQSTLIWLMAAAILLSLRAFIRIMLNVVRATLSQSMIAGLGFLASIGLAILFVPQYGTIGAAWALLGSAAVTLLLYAYVLRRQWDRLIGAIQ